MAWKRVGSCIKCGRCCQGFIFTKDEVIDRDKTRYYQLHNVGIEKKDGKTKFKITSPCKAFDPETKTCKAYKNRPVACMKYPTVEDFHNKNMHEGCGFHFEQE